MPDRIVIVQGHPDADKKHLCHALADAYARGATTAGKHVDHIDVAQLDFPILRSAADWNDGETPVDLVAAQEMILKSDHIVFIYPLWLGSMPALLKGFLEQILRPKMGNKKVNEFTLWRKLLKGTSARIIVTMGMPAFLYRWFYRAHSVKTLQRNVLAFTGVGPVRTTLIGMVEAMEQGRAEKLFTKMERLGGQAR